MKQYNFDPTKQQEFHQTIEFMDYDPPEYIQSSFERMKTEIGFQLYGILEQMTSPVVVELIENLPDIKPAPKEFKRDVWNVQRRVKAEIIVKLTPVRHKAVVYQNPIPVSYDYLKDFTPKPKTFIEKLKFVFGK